MSKKSKRPQASNIGSSKIEANLKLANDRLTSRIKKLEIQLKGSGDRFKSRIKKLEIQLKGSGDRFKSRIKNLETQKDKLNSRVKKLDIQLKDSKSERDTFKLRIKELEVQLASSSNGFKSRIKEIKLKIEELLGAENPTSHLKALHAQLDELEQYGLSSRTKKDPPDWVKPNKKSSSKKPKKRGAKKGHKANPRKKVDLPITDEVNWIPELCQEGCGPLPFPGKWHDHIQIDMPLLANLIVTKHSTGWSWCKKCGKYRSASHDKLRKTKYGPNIHAYVSNLKFNLGLTLGKIHMHLSEQFNLKISTGVLSEMLSRTSEAFEKDYEGLKDDLKSQQSLYADETGWRNGGKNEWLWSFSNEDMSVYTIDPSRGQKVVEDVLGESFNGTLVSDFYAGYNKIECDAKQKCWAHLLRDVHVLKQQEPENKEVTYFHMRLNSLFKRAQRIKEQHNQGVDILLKLCKLEADTLMFFDKGFETKKLKTLIKRMEKYYCDLYTFITADVEPTNNRAEREIRPAVLLRKISYCNRSDRGKKAQAIAMSMISTSKKQKKSFMQQAIENLKNANSP